MEEGQPTIPKPASSWRRLADTLVSTLRNRVELLALELQEERRWTLTTLVWTAIALFLGFATAVIVTFTIIFLCPEQSRPWVLVGFSVVYVALTTGAILVVRKKIKDKPPPLSDSLAELRKDFSLFSTRE